MLNRLGMGRSESVLTSQGFLLFISHAVGTLLSPVQIRDQGENNIREQIYHKPPEQKYMYICLFQLDMFSDLLQCTASPAALPAQGGGE